MKAALLHRLEDPRDKELKKSILNKLFYTDFKLFYIHIKRERQNKSNYI